MLETTSESVYQRGICGTGKTLGKIPEFRGCGKKRCCNRVEQNVIKVGASFDLIRSDLHRSVERGMSHYVRNRAHVWSTKEVQIGAVFK